jgi:hypothetical protein
MTGVKIQGLTSRQRKIADILWMMNGRDQVNAFIASLQGDFRRDAETVVEMMILAILDECQDVAEAQQILKPYRLTGL